MRGPSAKVGAAVAALQEFFSGWRFPVLLLFLLLFSTVALILMLVFPRDGSEFGEFAEQFRRWCLGVDAATGKAQWGIAAVVISQPLLLGIVTIATWFKPLRAALAQSWVKFWPWAGGALCLVAFLVGLLSASQTARADRNLAFPAKELRTAFTPPSFSLADQDGQLVSLAGLRGKPVLLTAVYASCGGTCPVILQQAKRVIESLPARQREAVKVLAITLDPENDSREVRAHMARMHGLSAPAFHLLGGSPAEVNRVLDAFGFERKRNSESGVIDHANLFLLIDAAGRIAYRFTLGQQQERWLTEALALLLQERQL
jgi:protein SCO1/2